jgi:hypothetical protein
VIPFKLVKDATAAPVPVTGIDAQCEYIRAALNEILPSPLLVTKVETSFSVNHPAHFLRGLCVKHYGQVKNKYGLMDNVRGEEGKYFCMLVDEGMLTDHQYRCKLLKDIAERIYTAFYPSRTLIFK